LERSLIGANEEFFGSKLAYQIDSGTEQTPQARITQEGDSFGYDRETNHLTIPEEGGKEGLAYFSRVLADANSVSQGLLPLHAAAVRKNRITLVLLAGSNGGKSLISDYLAQEQGAELVGDDHIIIGNGQITGNRFIGKRDSRGDKTYKEIQERDNCLELGDYVVIVLDANTEGRTKFKRIDPATLLQNKNVREGIQKYLVEDVQEDSRKVIESVRNPDVLERYDLALRSFIQGAQELYAVSGEKQYVGEKIGGILK
ncbi:MAG: hypothetical protein ACE5ES_00915, partial [Candidatus Nanoarchaeia archaeon]